ncbi:MAG: hypothetical protein HXN18_06875 [Porphyromonas sp.]|uniref:hypothetical protein n=1 Tax=Porphyromonas sp. TaxID=1924944 RepID=UPI001CAF8C08|nr:hypothetical protein [Porphyromonas sp.]MBF1371502.1 hypothetical protein [Porphyromonas sp.]
MPTHIKALKCPQCGSTRATKISEDHYRCDSCSTEFFLDSDDITIHHKVETKPAPNTFLRRLLLIILAPAAFFSLITIGLIVWGSSREGTSEKGSGEEHMSYACERLMAFSSTAGRPIVVLCGAARRDDSSGDWVHAKGFMYFFDGETYEIIKKLELPDVTGRVSVTDARQFEDGTFYVVLNEKRLFAIDRSTLDVKEIHGEDYKLPELSEGFGKVALYFHEYGDALKVETNLGKKFVYYPIANKLYTDQSIFKAYEDKLPAPKLRTRFTFSEQMMGSVYKDEQIQLVRYQTLEQLGYPRRTPHFGWENDRHSYYPKKIFVSQYFVEESRLQSYEDFTPGAYYFSPTVLYESDDQILISFKPTAAADAKKMLRCLDAQTGQVLWSCSEGLDGLDFCLGVARFSGGYVLVDYSHTWLISSEGKVMTCVDIHSRFR